MAKPDNQIEVARYTVDILQELEKIATSAGLVQQATLLRMARAEAELIVHRTTNREPPVRRRFLPSGQMLAANRFAEAVLPLIRPLVVEGMSLRKIAEALNARGVPTPRGGKWTATQVVRVLRRAG
jgi:hypothetical protein